MKHIQSYTKLFEKNNKKELRDFILKSDDGGENLLHYYDKHGAIFTDDYNATNFWRIKYLATDEGKNTSVIFFEYEWEHTEFLDYIEVLSGKKYNDLFDKNLLEGEFMFFNNNPPTLTCRGLVKKDTLDVIVNNLYNIKSYKKLYKNKDLWISIGSGWRAFDTVLEVPYKDYNVSVTDTTLSLLYKILSMYHDDDELLKDFDIVSAVSPLPNDIKNKVIEKFNRMFGKKSNMKIRVLPKRMTQAEYNHKKTKYKFTESKDIEI